MTRTDTSSSDTAHPLRHGGPGRALYATGLTADLAGVCVLLWVTSGALIDAPVVQGVSLFVALALQSVARRLRGRAWWHVPLRGAGPVPDRVELAFWCVCSVVFVVSAAVQSFGPPPEFSFFGPWFLVVVAIGWAWMPTTDRPAPEPPALWRARAVPLLTAAVLMLALGTLAGRMDPVVASAVAAVVIGGTVVVRRIRRRRD